MQNISFESSDIEAIDFFLQKSVAVLLRYIMLDQIHPICIVLKYWCINVSFGQHLLRDQRALIFFSFLIQGRGPIFNQWYAPLKMGISLHNQNTVLLYIQNIAVNICLSGSLLGISIHGCHILKASKF